MYQIEVDPHTHSLVSLHAYSTVEECARHAAERGLRGIAVTDHCSLIMAQRENSVEAILNQQVLPDRIGGACGRVWKSILWITRDILRLRMCRISSGPA